MIIVTLQKDIINRLRGAFDAQFDELRQMNLAAIDKTVQTIRSFDNLRRRIEMKPSSPRQLADTAMGLTRRSSNETMAKSFATAATQFISSASILTTIESESEQSTYVDILQGFADGAAPEGSLGRLVPSLEADNLTRLMHNETIEVTPRVRDVAQHPSLLYCEGATLAQESFERGFSKEHLPVAEGSTNERLCWKCNKCDFLCCVLDGTQLRRIAFAHGVRYRWPFLARSHLRFTQHSTTEKPRYSYRCLFCTEAGKNSTVYSSVDVLMGHIADKHRNPMSAEVRRGTRCFIGTVAAADEDWDCNIPDARPNGVGVGLWILNAVTSIPVSTRTAL